MTKEELIEKAEIIVKNNGNCRDETDYVKCYECPLKGYYCETELCRRSSTNNSKILEYAEKWLSENNIEKKENNYPINKREKLEARLSQMEETTKKAFTCICDKEGHELGVFRSGKYTVPLGDMNPEQAVQFAKWVLDLEGGK